MSKTLYAGKKTTRVLLLNKEQKIADALKSGFTVAAIWRALDKPCGYARFHRLINTMLREGHFKQTPTVDSQAARAARQLPKQPARPKEFHPGRPGKLSDYFEQE